mmetsp:Transcript_11550/g.31013  ORF Transcript_11550/g.31013 Transcript_11550/m.31013 type:complete len:207 (+) Transcript_11550:2-622(+)
MLLALLKDAHDLLNAAHVPGAQLPQQLRLHRRPSSDGAAVGEEQPRQAVPGPRPPALGIEGVRAHRRGDAGADVGDRLAQVRDGLHEATGDALPDADHGALEAPGPPALGGLCHDVEDTHDALAEGPASLVHAVGKAVDLLAAPYLPLPGDVLVVKGQVVHQRRRLPCDEPHGVAQERNRTPADAQRNSWEVQQGALPECHASVVD